MLSFRPSVRDGTVLRRAGRRRGAARRRLGQV